jgi:hypothetical protein
MFPLPTVKVKSVVSDDNPHGYIVINEEDFDASVHEQFEEPAESPDDDEKDGETDSAKQDDASNGDMGGSDEGGDVPAYRAEHRGRGSYSVMNGDAEAVAGLTKDEAIAFNALSAAEKVAFVANAAKG